MIKTCEKASKYIYVYINIRYMNHKYCTNMQYYFDDYNIISCIKLKINYFTWLVANMAMIDSDLTHGESSSLS